MCDSAHSREGSLSVSMGPESLAEAQAEEASKLRSSSHAGGRRRRTKT